MRLSEDQKIKIVQAIQGLDANAQIYLYGSRVDDDKKGGDIDLLVLSQFLDFDAKLKILAQLMKDLGEHKIDLSIVKDKKDAFTQAILDEAIVLG